MMRVRMMVFNLFGLATAGAILVRGVSVLLHESAPPLRAEMKNPQFVADIDVNGDLAPGLLSRDSNRGEWAPVL